MEILTKTVLPMLLILSNDLVDASKMVASIDGIRYAHARYEVDRINATNSNNGVFSSATRKISTIKRIDIILTKNKENVIPVTPTSNRKSTKDQSSN